MAEFVTLELPDAPTRGVAVLRIDRPPLNLVDAQLAREVEAAARSAGEHPSVAALIVYGDERVFSAGDEMAELADLDPAQAARLAPDLQRALNCLAYVPQPTVAAISGYALGAGLELALSADHRIVGDNVKLGFPQIKAGLIPLAGIRKLSLLIGPSKAKDLVYSGRYVGADEALKLGLVDEVVAPDDVLKAARAWASKFVRASPRALAAAKAVFEAGPHGHSRAVTEWSALFNTADTRTGTASVLADGPNSAEFTGE
ncbi:enoyl-CoA hydratase-related protein [Nocardia camponoti]|uniref:Enoyl-CoA hydratase n=1 Tax=Nocardia camponoti TaxID=1616106 RepID=A0A917V6Q2_9NOCA|nr:enoyl-CoA hydratase-related protein [Nocardia camponoti]GGK44189.1 enoyl-CoA hydratase [Nocardia camponoti]